MSVREQYISFAAIFHKEIVRFIRIWIQTIVPPLITSSLYFLIFGTLIGRRLGDINGHSYMEFITPGLIMMSVITNSYMNVCSSFFSSKFQRSVEELLVSPTHITVIILAYCLSGMLRGLICGALVFLVALFFQPISIVHPFLFFAFSLLAASLFSLAGFINALLAKTFDDISIVPTFILTPLTYLGGIFYSIYQLPEFWQKISQLNPFLYIINGFRYGMLGVSDISVVFSFSLLVVLTVVMFTVCHLLFKSGVGIKS